MNLELCQTFGLISEVQWYNHKPASAVEIDMVKILCDFNIQTDHVIKHRRPNIVVLCKTERKFHLVDITIPVDKRIELKEQKKVANYSELRREVKKIWNLSQVAIFPVVIGVLGVSSKRLKDWLEKSDVKSNIELLQKAALLGTAKIVRHILET